MAEVRESELIRGVVHVEPAVHGDARGRFIETYRRSWFPLGREMVQGNRADRQAGAIVGMHYHLHQADYWYVISGHARLVLHDLRVGSPTEGTTEHIDLEGDDEHGVFIPPGVGHGFASISDVVLTYLVDNYYNPGDELGVAYDDPEIAADWGITEPILSARDEANPGRSEITDALRPHFGLRT
jgi:dTDP-4-dehydrorhamnose 3,5-epimerase